MRIAPPAVNHRSVAASLNLNLFKLANDDDDTDIPGRWKVFAETFVVSACGVAYFVGWNDYVYKMHRNISRGTVLEQLLQTHKNNDMKEKLKESRKRKEPN